MKDLFYCSAKKTKLYINEYNYKGIKFKGAYFAMYSSVNDSILMFISAQNWWNFKEMLNKTSEFWIFLYNNTIQRILRITLKILDKSD